MVLYGAICDNSGIIVPNSTAAGLQRRIAELERIGRFEADVRELTLSVSRTLSSTLNLPAGLARLCHAALPLFGARRAAAWMHDRRARELVLEAASDETRPDVTRLPLGSAPAVYAKAQRHAAPSLMTVSGERALIIPLRGRRRALGLLLLEGLGDLPVDESHLIDAVTVLGRQISTVIENTILFEDILQSRGELENTFNSLADLVLVCDRHGRVTNANRAFRERVAARVAQPIDRTVADLVGADLGEWLRDPGLAASLPAIGEEREFDDPVLAGHFSVRVTPLYGADRLAQGIVVVARDETAQVRLQTERAALSERLAQSEKLAALGQFVAGVAHELNNPLQGVLGHLELLRATGRVPRALQSELRVVYREADRAARIVNNLLVFAGSRRGERRRVNLNTVVSRSIASRAGIARRSGIKVIRDLDPTLPRIRGDAMLLQQAILNMIINAEHAIASVEPGTGQITISTRSEARGARVVIEVRDTGPGVAADVLPRIFEPFFTTKAVGEGTGLGLALAYGIVQDHAGEISARNDRRGGAVFRIVLPADKMEARRRTHHD
jgi:signal transduction histidine kinase